MQGRREVDPTSAQRRLIGPEEWQGTIGHLGSRGSRRTHHPPPGNLAPPRCHDASHLTSRSTAATHTSLDGEPTVGADLARRNLGRQIEDALGEVVE